MHPHEGIECVGQSVSDFDHTGWLLPPLVICAVGAHRRIQVKTAEIAVNRHDKVPLLSLRSQVILLRDRNCRSRGLIAAELLAREVEV